MTTRPLTAQLVRQTIAGDDTNRSLAAWARRRRWKMVLERFPDLEAARVVDLGGTADFWTRAPVHPAHLTLVNLDSSSTTTAPWIDVVFGDACDAARLLDGGRFDIVFSNSTIEHVGGHDRCLAFARSVRSLAPRHWIQTPYRYFPIEPHFVFPAFQFVPVPVRCYVAARWPLSYTRSLGGSLDDPAGAVMAVELLGRTQLGYYFPQSEIVSEKLFGIPKSIIAVAA